MLNISHIKRIVSLIWLSFFTILLPVKGQTFQPQANSIIESLKKTLPNRAEISVAIIHDGKPLYIGFRREGKQWVQIENKQSVFEIGSITKVFTSVLLAQAVIDGVVRLEDHVTSVTPLVLKGSQQESTPMTLVSLANHTSGLPRLPPPLMRSMIRNQLIGTMIWPYLKKYRNPYSGYSMREFTKHLERGVKLQSIPGQKVNYSNWGMELLGHILEDKRGANYEELLQEQVFNRLNMTFSTTHRLNIKDRLVTGRNSGGRKAKNWDLGAMEPAGAILSTKKDLTKFALANFDQDSVLTFTREMTYSDGKDDVALGWFLKQYPDGRPYVWHNGGTGGYSSSMAIDEQLKNAVVLLSNISEKNDVLDKTCFSLMELLSKKVVLRKEIR